MHEPFHQGEIAVQTRAGVLNKASRVGNGIHAVLPEPAQEFLRDQQFVIVGFSHEEAVWASFLWGQAGFMQATSQTQVRIDSAVLPSDPLDGALKNAGAVGLAVGLLAIEPATRQRMRVNGNAVLTLGGGITVQAGEVYANCPKYIQKREPAMPSDVPGPNTPSAVVSSALTLEQQDWIRGADTFFIASAHPAQKTADASHRGGNPGFVHLEDEGRVLVWPDYSGNAMFNTLGNLAVNPTAGVLFANFATGQTLQITGRAEILWEAAQFARFPGAERAVSLRVHRAVETRAAFPLRSELMEYSRFNPSV